MIFNMLIKKNYKPLLYFHLVIFIMFCSYVHVCMYVYMYVCMDVWMDGWMDGCMHVCVYVCMYRDIVLKLHVWIPHGKIADKYVFRF